MKELAKALDATTNGNRLDDHERCPWCGQRITHEKFDEIRERIEAEERKRSAEFELRLQEQVAHEKADAQAIAKAQIEKARKVAEAAVKPKLVEAEKARKAAERKVESIKSSQQTVLNQRLQEQRQALEKDKAKAVNAEKSRIFKEKLKLEEKVDILQRQLQSKTASELGEGAEIDLFEALRGKFPHDDITRVGKGKEGADIIHKVVDGQRGCGCIVYDSKNRNAWRNEYVTKLRSDQLAAKADHAILATRVFPAGVRQIHIQDGVIVSNPARTLVIVEMLRKHIVQIAAMRLSNESRHEKMVTLYDFINSDRFGQILDQIETQTDDLLEIDVKEKKAHDLTWNRRGELIRAVQRVQADLSSEIDRIIGESPVERSARAT